MFCFGIFRMNFMTCSCLSFKVNGLRGEILQTKWLKHWHQTHPPPPPLWPVHQPVLCSPMLDSLTSRTSSALSLNSESSRAVCWVLSCSSLFTCDCTCLYIVLVSLSSLGTTQHWLALSMMSRPHREEVEPGSGNKNQVQGARCGSTEWRWSESIFIL